MAKSLIGILCLFAANFAHALTFQQRNDLEFKFGAIVKTAQNKYLPAKRVKDSLADAQGENLKVLKALYADWPKSYSKDINYKNLSNGILLGYKGVPLLEYHVTSLNPYTIQVNGKYEVKFENGEGLKELNEVLAKEGFSAKGSKNALFNFFLPDAVAADDAVKTFKNSVILTSNFGYELANKKTQELVNKGFLLPDERLTGFFNRDPISCNGDTAEGKLKDTDGNVFEFKASRKDGFEMKYKTMVVKSKNNEAGDYNCKNFSSLPESVDSMTFDKLTDSEVGKKTRDLAVRKAMYELLDASKKECISKEIKALIAIESASPDSRIAASNWDEKAYYEAVNGGNRHYDKTRTLDGHIRNKCLYLQRQKVDSDEGQAEMRKQREKAESDFDGHAGQSVRFAYEEMLKSVNETCGKMKKVKPNIDLDCKTPKTVGEAKKLCAQVEQAGISTGSSVEICFADKKCEPFVATHIFFDKQQAIFDKRIAYHDARSKFMKDYAKEIAAKTVTENADGSFDISSNSLDGSRLRDIKQDLGKLGELATAGTRYVEHNPQPTLNDYISGAVGFLDCCYDVECKNSLAQKGIELKPSSGATTVK